MSQYCRRATSAAALRRAWYSSPVSFSSDIFGTADPFFLPTFPWRGKVRRRPSAAVLLRKERRRGASATQSAAGWGESARSALLLPASPSTPPRVPSGRDPPPPGEGEVTAR